MMRAPDPTLLVFSTRLEHEKRALALGAEAVHIRPNDLDELSVFLKDIVQE